jgi:hypothetical protein
MASADLLENAGDADPAALDHGVVHVGEIQAETLGDPASDGRLAGAHGADHHEVGGGIHRCE